MGGEAMGRVKDYLRYLHIPFWWMVGVIVACVVCCASCKTKYVTVPVESNDTITLSVITLTAEELAKIEADKLAAAKADVLDKITAYDSSSAVNEFTLNGSPMWLDPDQRTALQRQINARIREGETTMKKIYNDHSFEFPLTQWQSMLDAVEIYAGDALNVTEQHILNAKEMVSSSDVEAYDYTTGYPAKLVL